VLVLKDAQSVHDNQTSPLERHHRDEKRQGHRSVAPRAPARAPGQFSAIFTPPLQF
jgi:hypothetical protein